MRLRLSIQLVLMLELVKGNSFRTWRKIGFGADAEIREGSSGLLTGKSASLFDRLVTQFLCSGEHWDEIQISSADPTQAGDIGWPVQAADIGRPALMLIGPDLTPFDNPFCRTFECGLYYSRMKFLMRIAVSRPDQTNIIYIGNGHVENTKGRKDPCVMTEGPMIYRSEDNGTSWKRFEVGLPHTCTSIDHLVMDPLNPAALYISLSHAGTNPTFTYSKGDLDPDGSAMTFATEYITDFIVNGRRVSAMSFTSDGLVLTVAYENGQVKFGRRVAYGTKWLVIELSAESDFVGNIDGVNRWDFSYQSLAVFPQSSNNGLEYLIYAGSDQPVREDAGMHLGSVKLNQPNLTLNSSSWTAAANTWDAVSSGWDASSLSISAILTFSGAGSLMYLVDMHRLFTSGSPYASWEAKYSSQPNKRKGFASHGSDTHEFTYVVSKAHEPSELLFGSETDVLYTSGDGGATLMPAKVFIEQASQLNGGPRTFKFSREAIEIPTSPSMFLIHCASNMTKPGPADARLFLKKHDEYVVLSNQTSLLDGNVSFVYSAASGNVILATATGVYEISGLQSIAAGLTWDLNVVQLGHDTRPPQITAREWNITMWNNTRWWNASLELNSPKYFQGPCSRVVDIAKCDSCSGPNPSPSATHYILVCVEGVYHYSSVLTTSTQYLGFEDNQIPAMTREHYWTIPNHCSYWISGATSGTNCAGLTASRPAWEAHDFTQWLNGGKQITINEEFKGIFLAESASSVSSAMILVTNRAIHIQYDGVQWMEMCTAQEVMAGVGWGIPQPDGFRYEADPTGPEFITATFLPDSSFGYRLVVAVRHHNQDSGEPTAQASKVIVITPSLNTENAAEHPNHKAYNTAFREVTEDLGPVSVSFFSITPSTSTTQTNDYFYVTTACNGAWTWHKKSLVSSGTDLSSWQGGELSDVSAFGNKSLQVSSTVASSDITSSSRTMYRLDIWIKGDCLIRVSPKSSAYRQASKIGGFDTLTEDHLITTVSSPTTGAWLSTRLEMSLPSTSSEFTLQFEKVGTECYVDRPFLAPASDDVNLNDVLAPTPRFTRSELLASIPAPVLISATATEINITWSAPSLSSTKESFTGFKIEHRLLGTVEWTPTDVGPSESNYTLPLGTELGTERQSPPNGASYQIRVSTQNIVGYSEPSDPLLATCQSTTPDRPGTPVLVNNARSREVMLSWAIPSYDGASAITGYKLKINGETSPIIFDTNSGTVTGLDAGQTYSFSALALNAVGESFSSAESDSIATIPILEGLCNVTMRLVQSTTITENFPAGVYHRGSVLYNKEEADWLQLFLQDLSHVMGISYDRISDMTIQRVDVVKISPTGLRVPAVDTLVNFNLKSGYLSTDSSLAAAKETLLEALVEKESKLYKGVVAHEVDSTYLRYDNQDPGVDEARQALGGSNARLNENTMQIIGIILFVGLPTVIYFQTSIVEWFEVQARGQAHLDKYDV